MSVFPGLDNLKDALDDVIHHDHQKDTPVGHSKTQADVKTDIHQEEHKVQKKSGSSWSDKIKDALDGDDEERKKQDEALRLKAEKEKAEAKERIKNERGFTGKIQDLLDHGEARKKQEEAEFARIDAETKDECDKQMGFRGKVLDVLDGPDARSTGSKPAAEYGLKDRVSELWGGQTTQNAEQKDLGDKFLDVLGGGKGKKQKEKEDQRNWFANKVNEMAGGGQAGELDEDKLDKAVDLFQHHILKKGDQSDESAIEQLKDEQIASAIRLSFKSVTGQDLKKDNK